MKTMKSLALILMSCCCISMMAEQKTPPQIVAEAGKARVVRDAGQEKLVLITGRTTRFESKEGISLSADIELRLDEETWNSLLDLVDASWGEKPIRMKALDGANVDIQKAKINSVDGLIFTSGTAYVAVPNRDLKSLIKRVLESYKMDAVKHDDLDVKRYGENDQWGDK